MSANFLMVEIARLRLLFVSNLLADYYLAVCLVGEK